MKNELFPNCKTIHGLILVMVALMVGLTTGLASVPAYAADEEIINKGKGDPVPENIGFMENPPKELTEKFPMCDAFLKVEWIDKEKKIGYSHYDLYRDGKREKEKAFALIHIHDVLPHFDYDLSVLDFEGVGKIGIKEVFSIIKEGNVFFNTFYLSIEYDKSKLLNFRTIGDIRDIHNFTLADHKINVCIPFPDNRRMWIAEGKQINRVYSKEETAKIVAKIKAYVPDIRHPEESDIFDLNFDGMEDYISGEKVVYSFGNKYYDMKALWTRDSDAQKGQWSFPPTQNKCELKIWVGGLFITTDGESFFLNNQCNLTELTQGGK